LREPIRPTWYQPFEGGGGGTFVVRTEAEPARLAQPLRAKVTATRPEYLVSTVRTQEELVRNQTIRERLLATLSSFFAIVALVLAGVGLCGVMHYAVLQRRREIGIRLALGASAMHVARQVTGDVGIMLALGSAAGLGAGLLGEQYVRVLLFGVQATDGAMIGLPMLTLAVATALAAIPPVVHALRIDPVTSLKSEG
jgi:putative ABC transport system permease protein